MCLIVVKPKDASWDFDALEVAAANNPHGAGLAWAAKGNLYVARRMTFAQLKPVLQSAARRPAVLHLRFATHGSQTLENVHPFHVKGHPGLVFAHNGIIGTLPRHEEMSDTRLFNRDVLAQLPHRFEETPKFLDGMAQATSSRFAFLRRDGRWFLSGDFHTRRGCRYSNYSYYRPAATVASATSFSQRLLDGFSLVDDTGRIAFNESIEGYSR